VESWRWADKDFKDEGAEFFSISLSIDRNDGT
jgi:hypothetical protein